MMILCRDMASSGQHAEELSHHTLLYYSEKGLKVGFEHSWLLYNFP
jgi:hypothetical protein